MSIERLEREKDEAESEMEALKAKELECVATCRAAFEALGVHCNRPYVTSGYPALAGALEHIAEAIGDFTERKRAEIHSRKVAAEDALGNLEDADLQKSAVR